MAPTRLFSDAQSAAGWRQKGFFSALNDHGGALDDNLKQSLLYHMIELGRSNPLAANAPVPEEIELGFHRKNVCPAPGEFANYAYDKPLEGMPLAITGLTDGEYRTLRQWIREGAVIDAKPSAPGPARRKAFGARAGRTSADPPMGDILEPFGIKEPIGFPVPVRTPVCGPSLFRGSGYGPIRIIATVRPNDDPGEALYYRLRKVDSTIVHKTHMAYPLDEERMARFEALFLAPDWDVAALPDYSRENAINPFATFAAIPAPARYRFMLDSSEFFVRNFIRGPVCAGQVATNVIDDRFFVVFQDPDADLSVTDPAYQAEIQPHLVLVPEHEGLLKLPFDWDHRKSSATITGFCEGGIIAVGSPRARRCKTSGTAMASMTMPRNFDNAMVTKGFVGAVPKTLWVMDYPLLERSYYLLVVNFDVFGAFATQVETRFYFDLIRSEGEDNFLHFMPPQARTSMRASWYLGSKAQNRVRKTYTIVNEDHPVRIQYRTADPKAEFVSLVTARLKSLAGPRDVLNRCAAPPCHRADAGPAERRADASLQTLTSKPASLDGMRFVDFMPDVSFLRVDTGRRGLGLYAGAKRGAHQCRVHVRRRKTSRA
jgi:hypothetical protein